MGIGGNHVLESMTKAICESIEKKIEKYPQAEQALKELGIELLDELPNRPEWARKFYQLFRS